MHAAFLRFYSIYGKLLRGAAIIAGLATFLIMWIIDVNVFTRKLFNAPLPAGVEAVTALLPAVILLPFGYALLARQHVNSLFLTSRMSIPTARVLHVLWMLVGFVVFCAVTYGTFQYAMRSYAMGEQVWGATIRFAVWPSKLAISIGTALIAVQFLLDALRALVVDDPSELITVTHHEIEVEDA